MFRRKSRHRLITIGDSLTLGFNNGCIYRTDLNYPSMLARSMSGDVPLEQPVFTAQGGLPLNLEILIRGLCDIYGKNISPSQYIAALRYLYVTARRIKRYWDGGYIPLNEDRKIPYHNQSVWGYAVNDAWLMNEKISREYIETHPAPFNMLGILHGNAMYTTTRCVLNPSFGQAMAENNMIENARYFAENGGIENLIVFLGANNITGAVTDLRIRYSEKDQLEQLPFNRNYTVTRPEHFELLYRKLAEKVSSIRAERIITASIPHITIPPVTRGINSDLSTNQTGYFDYYTRFWIWDDTFDPEIHPYLTKEQAIELDQLVDDYNQIIKKVAKEYGWLVVPLGELISTMANRRLPADSRYYCSKNFIDALKRNPKTRYLVKDNKYCSLSAEYLRLNDENGLIYKGGIFSLDGLHPTTIGYGFIAEQFYEVMRKNGVRFERPLDWDFIIANDSLVTNPPYLLIELRRLLRFLALGPREQWAKLSSNLFTQVMSLFSPGTPEQNDGQKNPGDSVSSDEEIELKK